MSGERCRDLRPLHARYAAGRLDGHTGLRIQAHLADGCRYCAAEIDTLMEAFATLGTLVQEAELVRSQVEAGHAWETNLANRGRQVDDLTASVQNTMGTIALLDTIQTGEEA